jgi:hypothetical protein
MPRRQFDETQFAGDKWIADCKGKIRSRADTTKIGWERLSRDSGVAIETIMRVMWYDNIRHTTNTIVSLGEALGIRFALVEKDAPIQPDELKELSSGRLRQIRSWVAKGRADREKRQKARKKKNKKKAK